MQQVDLEDVAIVGRPNAGNVAVITVDLLELCLAKTPSDSILLCFP
jgi:hypothetical protein